MAGVGTVGADDGRVVGGETRRVGEVVGDTDSAVVVVPSAAAMTGCTVVTGAVVVSDGRWVPDAVGAEPPDRPRPRARPNAPSTAAPTPTTALFGMDKGYAPGPSGPA